MIGRICTREVYTAAPGETVEVAAQRMRSEDVGTLVVVEDGNKPVGLITDRDIVMRCIAEARSPLQTRVEDVMSAPAICAPEDMPIEDALDRMAALPRRRLVVTDEKGLLVGVLALDDILELLAEETQTIGRMVRRLPQEPATPSLRRL